MSLETHMTRMIRLVVDFLNSYIESGRRNSDINENDVTETCDTGEHITSMNYSVDSDQQLDWFRAVWLREACLAPKVLCLFEVLNYGLFQSQWMQDISGQRSEKINPC